MEGKTPSAQVADDQGDQAPESIDMQWGTTINASTVLVLVEQHKLEQDAATSNLQLGRTRFTYVDDKDGEPQTAVHLCRMLEGRNHWVAFNI